jgi:hypothetical protein
MAAIARARRPGGKVVVVAVVVEVVVEVVVAVVVVVGAHCRPGPMVLRNRTSTPARRTLPVTPSSLRSVPGRPPPRRLGSAVSRMARR